LNLNTGFKSIRLTLLCVLVALVLLAPFSVPWAESKSSHHSKSSVTHGESAASPGVQGNSGIGGGVSPVTGNNNSKVIMINFDDSYKTQVLYAKPILDQYGFKATFFEVCGWVDKNGERQTWQDVAGLLHDGNEIASHTMTHAHLNGVSTSKLYFELGGAKECFVKHGYPVPLFGYPDNLGSGNKTVVNVVSKYYDMARSGSDPLMFLDCKGYQKHPQANCTTFSPDGALNYVNIYDIRSQSFDHIHSNAELSQPQLFQQFIQRVNSQIPYNKNGVINAIPIITFHNLTYSNSVYNQLPSTIMVPLFAQMMKYLHDNGFKTLTMDQLGYDSTKNVFYVKNTQSQSLSNIKTAPTPSTSRLSF
jgi:polysaccharide deacetylase